jgi:uncharacterized coiled-coil DUF342 family protein
MAMDDRIIHLVRQEVDRVLTEADAGPDSLHTELHALATRLAGLEEKIAKLESAPRTAAGARAKGPSKTATDPA